jgi:trimeric autotransporter adhesin
VFANGLINTIAGAGVAGYTGDGGPATSATLNGPSAIAITATGSVYVADANNNAVRLLQPAASGSGIGINAIVSGASNLAGPIAPGEVVVIYGSGLGPSTLFQTSLGSNGLLPTTASGTTVYFGSIAAPILYTSANQVGAIVPFGVSGSQVAVSIVYNGQFSAAVPASVATAVPAIFTLNMSGSGQAVAINQDGSLNSAAKPAKTGSYISLYLTGAGQTNPSGADGQPGSDPLPVPILPVTASVDGKTATVQYAGGAQGIIAGVLQVNIQIPAGVTAGSAVPIVLQVGTNSTQPNVTVAVSN